jgi:hypothetical protein
MPSPNRFLVGLLLCAGAASAGTGSSDGLSISAPYLERNQPIYGENASTYQNVFLTPDIWSVIGDVNITEDRPWTVHAKVVANVSVNDNSGSNRQVTSVLTLGMKPSDGGFPGNSTYCYTVFQNMKEETEKHLLRVGSRHCQFYFSNDCTQDLSELHQDGCSGQLPASCTPFLERRATPFSKFLVTLSIHLPRALFPL